jgi:hypothetical protein
MIDSQSTTQEELQAQAAFVAKAVKGLGYRRIVLATADPSYPGGNPKVIMDVEDGGGAAADEALPVIMALAHTNAKPSGILVVMEVAPGEFVVVGEVGDLTDGKRDDSQWVVPVDYPTSESTLATTSAALLHYCPKTLNINKVVFQVSTGQAAAEATVKLYSADGGSVLIDTGAISVSSNGRKTATISPAVKITPNDYRIEYTCTDGTVAIISSDLSSNGAAFLNEGINARTTNGGGGTPTNVAKFPWIKFMEV